MSEIFKNSRVSFYGGHSEDDAIGPDGTYLYGENIESKKFSKFVELAKAPISILNNTDLGGSTINLGAETPDPQGGYNVFFLGNDGKIINTEKQLVYTDSQLNDLEYHSFSVGDTYYYTSSTGSSSNPLRLNSILHENIDSSWTVNEDILNGADLELIEPGATGYNRFLVIGNIAYISSGRKIAKYNHNTQEVESQFDFFPDTIVGMTYGGGHIKVFLKNGLMYLWDGVNSEQPLDVYPLGEKLENAVQIGAIEYVIGGILGQLSKFFVLDGNRLVQIYKKQYSKLLSMIKFNIATTGNYQNIDSSDNQIFLLDLESGNNRISSYGNQINGLPKGYTVDLTRSSNGNFAGNVTFIFQSDGKLYFGYSNGGEDRGVDYINLDQTSGPYASEGYIIDKLFDGGDIIEIKKEEKLIGKCEVPIGTSIEVYQSTNGSAFQLIKEILPETNLDNGAFTLSDQSFKAGTKYRQITYKTVLKTIDPNITPVWYGYTTGYSFT